MASKAKSLIVVFIYWFVIGLIWATLYDTINTTIPSSFSYATINASGTWEVLKWIWLAGLPIIAVGTGLAAVNQKNQFSFGHALVMNVLAFVIWFITIFMWAALYEPFLVTIPSAFNAWFTPTTDTSFITTLYNGAAILIMIGFGVIGVSDAA